jgi:hypothetical protein
MTMKKLAIFTVTLFTIISCINEPNMLPRYTGSAGEIVVIVNTSIWDGDFGDSVRVFFEQATPHLPQPEAKFYLGQYKESGFNNLLQQHRNIFVISVDNKNPKNELNLIRSKWSKGQVVVQLKAVTVEDAIDLFVKSKTAIMELFDEAEKERLQSKFYGATNEEVAKILRDTFKIAIQLPADMLTAVGNGDQALWFKQDRVKYLSGVGHDISQGLVIYELPYNNDSTFTNDFAIYARNEAVQVVTGNEKNKYMATELEFYPPEGKLITVNGNTAWYSTGLWNMTNDFMGGPFVNMLILDEKNQRLIGIDGYVFAPKFNKREYVREMEAMVKSIKLLD